MFNKQIASRQKELDQAATYAEWQEIATELDRLEGGEAWKQDEMSDDYDYLLIKERLNTLRELRKSGEVRQLVFQLAEGLHGNLGNVADPVLYSYARVGTKRLVEEYIEESARCLDYVCVGDFPDFSNDEKILFFKRTGTSFGRSALLLSGGATLGMFHLGVIKAMFEHNVLPRVISGSSAGAIIASMVGTRTDDELPAIFDQAIGCAGLDAQRRCQALDALSVDRIDLDRGTLQQLPKQPAGFQSDGVRRPVNRRWRTDGGAAMIEVALDLAEGSARDPFIRHHHRPRSGRPHRRAAPGRPRGIARAVSGDHDLWRRSVAGRIEPPLAHAERVESFADDGIVDELSEDGDWFAHGGVMRGAEGIAHAEAHAVVLG